MDNAPLACLSIQLPASPFGDQHLAGAQVLHLVFSEDLQDPTVHNFGHKLALTLINNEYIIQEEGIAGHKRKRCTTTHDLLSATPHAEQFCNGKLDTTAKSKYQQHRCKSHGCNKQVCIYCACTVGHWMCQSCHREYIVDIVMSVLPSD